MESNNNRNKTPLSAKLKGIVKILFLRFFLGIFFILLGWGGYYQWYILPRDPIYQGGGYMPPFAILMIIVFILVGIISIVAGILELLDLFTSKNRKS